MKLSEKGLALIKSQEGSVGRFPPGPALDAVDERRINVAEYRQLISGQAEQKSFSDDADFAAGQLLSGAGNKASFPLLFGVDGERHPFKVFGAIVCLDPVDVVDGEPLFVARNERSPDKSVNQKLFSSPLDLDCNDIVSMRLIRRRQYLVWLRSNVRRSPSSGRFVGVGPPPDAAMAGYIKHTLVARDPIDFFPLLHASPCKNMRGESVA